MELEEHVLLAIEDYDLGRLYSSLGHACNAINGTARNLYSKDVATNFDYKRCIRHYYWIMEPMIGPGLNLEETKWDNVQIDNSHGKPVPNPDLADVIYHIFRCNDAHGKSVPEDYHLTPTENGESVWLLSKGSIHMPERVIFGLLAISVFAQTNAHIKTTGEHYLSWGNENQGIKTTNFIIKDCWGRENDFRTFITPHNTTRIKLEKLHNIFKS